MTNIFARFSPNLKRNRSQQRIDSFTSNPRLLSLGMPFMGGMCSTVEKLNRSKLVATDTFHDLSDPMNCEPSFRGGPHHAGNFRSFHPGGAYFLFGDGHMDFISDSIDMEVYQALSTIRGSEAVSDDY